MQPFDSHDTGRVEFDRQSHDSGQAGVKKLEAIASTWTKQALYIAYLGIALMTCATSLESQTTTNLTVYATSSFSAHALISTVLVVQGVVLSVVKPPMSKVADVFGRFEAFGLSICLYVGGYIQQAASYNVESYAAAQIFYAAGQTGLQILIQIFIADTSDLLNRALIVTLPDVPFLVNVWVGPVLAEEVLKHLTWRWGYGIWAIVLPLSFLPLGLTLWTAQRKAANRGVLPPSPFVGKTRWEAAKSIWWEMDAFGLLMVCVGFSLVLIPLTIGFDKGWRDPGYLVMLIVGACCIIGFPFFERSRVLAPRAFFPRALFKNRTALAGIAFAFFYFSAFYLSVFPYFQSYLLVVHGLSVSAAGHVIQIFTFSATITSIIVSFGIKYWGRYRPFVMVGIVIYILGLIAMVFFRTEQSSLSSIVAAQILIGVGGGMAHGPAQLGVQASASHSEVAAATAGFLTLLEIGGAVGSAISGAIWSANIPDLLEKYLPDETKDQAAAIYGSVKLASTGWPMGSPTRIAINHAYQETMTKILIVAVCMATPCIFLTFLMKDYRLHEIDQHVKGVVIGSIAQNATDQDAAEGGSSAEAPLLSNEREDERDLQG
ncbi:putative siderophore-dependent iron transporter [Teratosphaeria nubilosa]|uniref:Putative siderophore-dependent iron transporter n=1 Tax=Teratosphaeria nubilosa TaxID=161662 RepID=A0A6G1L6T1_9PEZI|nr:putative siderophore-dependent iron transporter [Teratosphaeria nubilosa]